MIDTSKYLSITSLVWKLRESDQATTNLYALQNFAIFPGQDLNPATA
jgi:hypothetical protein